MTKKITYTSVNILCLIWTVCVLYPLPSLAKKKEVDIWQTHETLTNRLSAEWYKIGIIRNDLESIRDILSDLRDFELYPMKITKLNEDKIVALDKAIEHTEKKVQNLLNKVNKVRIPLSDAIAILREMVIGQAVEDMFEVIEQGDMERISQLLTIKHKIDILWNEVDHLLNRVNAEMGFDPFKTDTVYGIEKEFFDVIKANLGKQSDEYYNKLNTMKNALIDRAGDFEMKRMYKIELHQLKESIKPNKEIIAQRKILLMKERYQNRRNLHELNILLTRIYYLLGDYHSTLETIDLLPDDPVFITEKVLYTIQSWYALEEFEKIWQWGKTFDFSFLIGENKNLMLWLVMECGFTLDAEKDLSTFAEQMNPQASYNLHIMHTLARSYLRDNQPRVSLSIFKKALQKEPEIEIDRDVYNRILLANAQTLFEIEDYPNALDQFFMLLNNGTYFEEALFGIAWCYIKLNMYQKAETTLRKLINQSPQDPRSAEAILVMTKRFMNKAQYEWKKTTYLTNEEKRLEYVIKKLSERIKTVQGKEKLKKYKSALVEISELLKQLKEEKREDCSGISAYYNHALNICDVIAKHYETGSFQEISFSEKREKILHQLDSLVLAGKSKRKDFTPTESFAMQQRQSIQTIKKLVDQSYVLSAEIQLSFYKWQKEYLDWIKMILSEKDKQIDEQYKQVSDTAKQRILTQKRKRLTARIDSLVLEDNKLNNYWYEKLSTMLTQLVETPLDSTDEIYLHYHLGELHYQDENRKFIHAYELYEKDMMVYDSMLALFHEGEVLEMPLEPKAPVLSHKKSMNQFRTITAKYPDNEFIFAPIYSLAWCYNDLGMFDSAVAQMTRVANDFSNAPYAPQAWMYLGEYHFDNIKLDSAIYAYRSVMKYPESEWFDDALYKLAWAQYRLSNPEKAISSFLALVDLGKDQKTGKALLETESLDYIAISFSESDITGDKGLKRAKAFCKKLGDTEKATQILHRLAGVYEEQGRYEMAKKSYQTLLAMYPHYEKNPLVESKLITVMERDLSLEEANKYKTELFKKYNRESPWTSKQTDPETIAMADSIAASQLYDASITYHQIALQNNDSTAYNQAMATYRDFIHYYPRSPQANECHYNLAEILFSTGQYYKAAEEYIAVSKRYPGSKYKETAAWNAIVASQNLLKQEGNKK